MDIIEFILKLAGLEIKTEFQLPHFAFLGSLLTFRS